MFTTRYKNSFLVCNSCTIGGSLQLIRLDTVTESKLLKVWSVIGLLMCVWTQAAVAGSSLVDLIAALSNH